MNKTYSILINDNIYLVKMIERKMKNIRLKLDGETIIVSGYHLTKEKADMIINKNYQWIISRLNKYQDKKNNLFLDDLSNFKKVYLYGELKDIILSDIKCEYFIDNQVFKYRNQIIIDKELKKIRMNNLDLLKQRFIYWCNVFNKFPIVQYKDMKSKYGYCKYKENLIVLSTRLVHFPLDIIDYVIVHEFCHFTVQNHSKKFYQEVAKYYKDYRLSVKRLKEYSLICK